MVWSAEREGEQPQLSLILPQLYLGAERDVTQEQLTSLGISYVVNVSRCSLQPTFLPDSRYLRIPIDDSLWADLLPWIPQALRFIDAALSSGASVLVHCAAGISRSAALAVAYIMYHLEMDLDHAYRFVKERRPSISPNFNFLGQLQHFQGTLSQRSFTGGSLVSHLDVCPSSFADVIDSSERVTADSARHGRSGENQQQEQEVVELMLHGNQQHVQSTRTVPPAGHHEEPTRTQASLSERRRSLTLSLSPLGNSSSSLNNGHHSTVGGNPSRKSRMEETKGTVLLSPFSFTLNKLMDWGERVLLGGVFMPTVRMGQPALPYRC
ncbi:tyrosine-protein phosphatase vhp-1 [Gouania willdenowi]|uniref:protein-tyrosine-phosphatase n=1 Tax=Gouania willdenowi TaxID=441366 RepID=A0A8C5DE11_GOUWI|nr:tyrosine-protein phosphatase vhp-1-like [Gouania willdenowi]